MKSKRLLSLLLTLLVVIGMIPTGVFAAETVTNTAETLAATVQEWTEEGVTWCFTDDGTMTITGTGEVKRKGNGNYNYGYPGISSAEILNLVIGEGITGIGDYGFAYCENLVSVTLPSTLTSIGEFGFFGCKNLTAVDIPNSVNSIGKSAFQNCFKLASVNLSDTLTKIEGYVFCNCYPLISIDIPETVTSIGDYAFNGCESLVDFILPDGLTELGCFSFSGCDAIEIITIPSGIKQIPDNCFSGCLGLKEVILPDSVELIDHAAFSNCSILSKVSFPANLKEIGDAAFSSTAITSIILAEGLTTIGEAAFSACPATSIRLPYTLTSIGETAFEWAKVEEIFIPESVTSLGANFIRNAYNLKSILVADANPNYCDVDGVLFNKNMTVLYLMPPARTGTYEIPDSVSLISDYSFYYSKLRAVWISSGVESIGDHAYTNGDSGYLFFDGDMPSITENGISLGHYKRCYYPKDNTTYTAEKLHGYGGDGINWVGIGDITDFEVWWYPNEIPVGTKFEDITWGGILITSDEQYLEIDGIEVEIDGDFSTAGVKKAAAVFGPYRTEFTITVGTPEALEAPVVTGSNVLSSGKNKLSWNKVEGAASYEIFRATSKTGEFIPVKTTTSTSWVDTSSVAGKGYYYIVLAVSADGNSASESELIFRTCDLPRTTVTLSNILNTGKIKVAWTKVEGAVSYEVYRATSKTGTYSLKKTTTNLSWTDTTATAGKTYYYKVKAIHTKSAANSAYSEVKSRMADLARPTVTLSNVASSGKIKVAWTKVTGTAKYQVYRSTTKNGTYSLKKTTTSLSWTDTNTTAGKTYYYKVKAVHSNTNANSALTAYKSRMADLKRPTVSITTSSGKPKVSWAAITGAKEYKIYRSTSKTGTYKVVKTTTAKYWKDTTAKKGKTYYYKVVAVHKNSSANSAYSTVVSKKCTK